MKKKNLRLFHFSCSTPPSSTVNHHLAQCTTTFTHTKLGLIFHSKLVQLLHSIRYEKWDKNLFWTLSRLVSTKKNHFELAKATRIGLEIEVLFEGGEKWVVNVAWRSQTNQSSTRQEQNSWKSRHQLTEMKNVENIVLCWGFKFQFSSFSDSWLIKHSKSLHRPTPSLSFTLSFTKLSISLLVSSYRFWWWNSRRCQSLFGQWRLCRCCGYGDCGEFRTVESLLCRIEWRSPTRADSLADDDVLEKRLGSEFSWANWAQIQTDVRRWNLDENLIELLMLVGWIVMLLGLKNMRIFLPSVETCKRMKSLNIN